MIDAVSIPLPQIESEGRYRGSIALGHMAVDRPLHGTCGHAMGNGPHGRGVHGLIGPNRSGSRGLSGDLMGCALEVAALVPCRCIGHQIGDTAMGWAIAHCSRPAQLD